MSERSPPSIPRSWLIAAGVIFALWMAYAVVVVQQILLGSLPLIAFAALYLGWRLLVAIEAIADGFQRVADGLQRLADQKERDDEHAGR